MSLHLNAPSGSVAPTVILPGDPRRAEVIARRYLKDCTQINDIRGMLGFTGTFEGKPVTVQGTGMGIPSLGIYVTELIREYGAKRLIRVGTCGSLRDDLPLRSVIAAISASSDSHFISRRFPSLSYAPTASPALLQALWQNSRAQRVTFGTVFTSDTFYDEGETWRLLASYGTAGIEMETAGLYCLAAAHGVDALSLLTVTDHLPTGSALPAEERQNSLIEMIELALSLV